MTTTPYESFGSRLAAAMRHCGPLCVGIDPHAPLLAKWDLPDDPTGLEKFAMTVVEAMAGQVAILKPQIAFFERMGSAGIAVLEKTLAAVREAGILTVVDAKRGDIGSTMAAYAQAYLDPASPLAADALTVSPYLGFGSLRPVLDLATQHHKGAFVLGLTSNPEGPSVQHARGADGRSVAQAILDDVAAENAGATPMGSIGVVVGATVCGEGRNHSFDVNGPILAPGIGAQGAGPQDLAQLFGEHRALVLPNSSREVLGAGPTIAGLRDAAQRTVDQVTAALELS